VNLFPQDFFVLQVKLKISFTIFGVLQLSYIWGKYIPVEAIRAWVVEENVVVYRSLFNFVQKIKLRHDKHDWAFFTEF